MKGKRHMGTYILSIIGFALFFIPVHFSLQIGSTLDSTDSHFVSIETALVHGNHGETHGDPEVTDTAKAPGANKNTDDGGCGLFSPGQCLINALGQAMVHFAGMFTWISAKILDASIQFSVLQFGTLMSSDLGDAVNDTWKFIRDICNLAFIFGIVYLGIRTIFDSESVSVRRDLTRIIIGALFINFSLLFAKVIIDISNIFGVQIYNTITQNGMHTLSEVTFSSLGLQTIFNGSGLNALTEFLKGNNSFTFFLMSSILLFITAFVFFVAAILLAIRFVHLIFLMITSPVLFGATVFPQTERYAKELWSKLINYSIFLPAYLLMISISFKAIDAMQVGKDGDFADALLMRGSGQSAPPDGTLDIIFRFLVIIFFMISSLGIAQKIGIHGAAKSIEIGNSMRSWAQGILVRGSVRSGLGATRLVSTGVIGAVNAVQGQENPLKKAIASTDGIQMKKLAKLQEDMRTSDSRRKRVAAGLMRGIGIEDGIQALNSAKFGSSESIADVDKRNEQIKLGIEKNKKNTERDELIAKGAGADAENNDKIKMERAIAGMGEADLLDALKDKDASDPTYQAIVSNMTTDQYEKVIKKEGEGSLSPKEKDALAKARSLNLQNQYGIVLDDNGVPGNPGDIHKMSSAQLEQIDPVLLREHAGNLTKSQVDGLKNLTRTQKEEFKALRKSKLAAKYQISGDEPGRIGTLTSAELDELDQRVVVNWAHHLSKKQIDGLKDKSSTDIENIKTTRRDKLIDEANAGGVANILTRFTNADDIAHMPAAVFLAGTENAQTVGRFTFDVLKKATTNPDLNDVRVRIKKQILAHYEQPAVQVAGAPQPPNPNQAKLIAYNNFFASPEGSAYTI